MIIKNENSLDFLAKLRHRLLGAGGLATMDAVHRFQMFTDFDKRLSDNPYGRSPDLPRGASRDPGEAFGTLRNAGCNLYNQVDLRPANPFVAWRSPCHEMNCVPCSRDHTCGYTLRVLIR